MTNRKLELRIHDTSLGIWQDDPNDPTFRDEVFAELIRQMRGRGWSIRADPSTKKHYPVLGPNYRLATKGTMLASIQIAGRTVELMFWANTWPLDNRNGPRYDFDKFKRMTYLDRNRFILETKRIQAWLGTISDLKVSESRPTRARSQTAMELIEASYAESCHTDTELGRPVCKEDYNRKSIDGHLIEHGQTVWFAGRDGRIRRGRAFYNINSMWWVTAGKYERHNLSCREIHCTQPDRLRQKRNDRRRRERLERELSVAIRHANYRRAELLHRILFGDDPAYLIWSRKRDSYYATNCCGYTSDANSAGRYTREEAEAEVRRVPHILEMVCPDGKRVRFEEKEAAA